MVSKNKKTILITDNDQSILAFSYMIIAMVEKGNKVVLIGKTKGDLYPFIKNRIYIPHGISSSIEEGMKISEEKDFVFVEHEDTKKVTSSFIENKQFNGKIVIADNLCKEEIKAFQGLYKGDITMHSNEKNPDYEKFKHSRIISLHTN